MKESSADQAILNEGREEGRQEGLELGREVARQTLLALGTVRFGKPSPKVHRAIAQISQPETLKTLPLRVLSVRNWTELLAEESASTDAPGFIDHDDQCLSCPDRLPKPGPANTKFWSQRPPVAGRLQTPAGGDCLALDWSLADDRQSRFRFFGATIVILRVTLFPATRTLRCQPA